MGKFQLHKLHIIICMPVQWELAIRVKLLSSEEDEMR